MQGWFKFHRVLFEKPIWITSTPEQKTILITLMGMANHKEAEWEFKGEKFSVDKGQFITSLESIVANCGKGVSLQNVRTALKRFEKYGFLTNESTNKNRLITIVNWGIYQGEDDEPNKQTNKQLTSNQQATNKQLTTNKNKENKENENNDLKETIPFVDIIDYLNSKAEKSYKSTSKKTRSLIKARWDEKFTLKDFEIVIDKKVAEWNGTDMDKYLRPETLFGNKFESYLNQKTTNSKMNVGTNRNNVVDAQDIFEKFKRAGGSS